MNQPTTWPSTTPHHACTRSRLGCSCNEQGFCLALYTSAVLTEEKGTSNVVSWHHHRNRNVKTKTVRIKITAKEPNHDDIVELWGRGGVWGLHLCETLIVWPEIGRACHDQEIARYGSRICLGGIKNQ